MVHNPKDQKGNTAAWRSSAMKKVRKAHGDKVILDDVTLSFYPGAKIGVVGPNRAGKSGVLRIMAGWTSRTACLPGHRRHRGHPAAAERGQDRSRNVEEGMGDIKDQARPLQRVAELIIPTTPTS